MKTLINCAYCEKQFEISHWLIKPGRLNHCSLSCNAKRKKEAGLLGPQSLGPELLKQVEHEYINTHSTIQTIVKKYKISRSYLFYHAKKNGWKKYTRSLKNRSIYRQEASRKIGRKLSKHEHVHHIDGDQKNNNRTNLHVFDGAKTHSECHGSLETVAFQLFRKGLIIFDETTGRYALAP